MEGALAELPKKLSGELQFDSIQLDGLPASKRFTLWFRYGAKRVFHVRMIRTGGRCLVEMGGIDPVKMLKTLNICRDHFDAWFDITSKDIRAFERPGMLD